MRSLPLPGGGRARSRPGFRLRYFLVGGFLATRRLLARLVGNRLHLDAALPRHAPRRGEAQQPVQRRAHHVVGVGRAQTLRQDVPDADALEPGAHRAAGEDAGTRRGGLEEHPPRPVVADDLVRDRATGEGDLDQVAPRRLDGLADGLADLVRFPGGDADASLPVAHGDERVEAEPPAALDDLGHPVDGDHVFDQAVAFPLALAGVAALAAPAAPPAASAPTPTARAAGAMRRR